MSEVVSIKHILVRHQYEAEDLLKKLQEGGSFEELAQKFSLCSSQKSGGDLGPITRERVVEDFADAAFSLPIGKSSGIVRTSFGYHILLRYA